MIPWATPCEPGARPRDQRALKAQQYKAWGNAPGTQPPNYCRAVGAKEVQAERHELARMVEAQPAFYKSSEASNQGDNANSHCRVNEQGNKRQPYLPR